jgi:hypothetical protein
MDEIWTKWPGEEVGPSAALESCRRFAASRQEGAPRLDLLAWPRAIGSDGRGWRRNYTAEQATLDRISKLSTASMTGSSEPRSPVWGMTATRPEQRGSVATCRSAGRAGSARTVKGGDVAGAGLPGPPRLSRLERLRFPTKSLTRRQEFEIRW